MRTMRHFRARSFVDRGPKKSGPDIEIKTVRDLKKKEKKMRLGRLPVNLSASTLSAIKKRAMNSGKSASEIVRELVESGLNNPSGFRDGSGAGHGPETIREVVSEAVMEALKGGGSGIPPELLRYLVQDLAKTENLLRQLSLFFSPGKPKEHEERVRIARQKSNRILKNLNLNVIEDVDRPEVVPQEEAEKMLREMGIIEGDGGRKSEGEK